jgi:hypothetical protein
MGPASPLPSLSLLPPSHLAKPLCTQTTAFVKSPSPIPRFKASKRENCSRKPKICRGATNKNTKYLFKLAKWVFHKSKKSMWTSSMGKCVLADLTLAI